MRRKYEMSPDVRAYWESELGGEKDDLARKMLRLPPYGEPKKLTPWEKALKRKEELIKWKQEQENEDGQD